MFHGAEQGSAACLETVLVETSDMEITRPEPDTLVFDAGGQSRDIPPNSLLVACTVQAVPAVGPPSQVNVSPTEGPAVHVPPAVSQVVWLR